MLRVPRPLARGEIGIFSNGSVSYVLECSDRHSSFRLDKVIGYTRTQEMQSERAGSR